MLFRSSACEPRPARALAHAQAWARDCSGAVLATGSVYLVGALLGELTRELPDRDHLRPAVERHRSGQAR